MLAVTPDTLEALREEAGALLDEIEEQATLLPSEDVALLRRRLLRARPLTVAKLSKDDLRELAGRVKKLHQRVRGTVRDPGWGDFLDAALVGTPTPREILRRVVLRLDELVLRA